MKAKEQSRQWLCTGTWHRKIYDASDWNVDKWYCYEPFNIHFMTNAKRMRGTWVQLY